MSAEDEGHDVPAQIRRYGAEGLRASSFPRWRDGTCPHPVAMQVPDGAGTLCLDCGALRIRV